MIFASTVSLDAKNERTIHRAILRNDTNAVVFDLCVVADSIVEWLNGFVQWAQTIDQRYAAELRTCAAHLDRCRFWPVSKPTPTFWRVAFALAQFLDQEPNTVNEGDEETAHSLLSTWLERHFGLSVHTHYEQGRQTYRYRIYVDGKTILENEQPLEVFSESQVSGSFVRAEWWTEALRRDNDNTRSGKVRTLLEHYDILQQAVHRQAQTAPGHSRVLHQSLVELTKALLSYLDQADELALSRSHAPDLAASIIRNSHDYDGFESRKPYLERLLQLREAPERKRQRLRLLARDLEKMPSLLTLFAGPVSAHYLNQYDLDEAAYFWRPLAGQQRLLRMVLSLYRHPRRFALIALFYFGVLWSLASLQLGAPETTQAYQIISTALTVWLLAVLLPICGGLIYVAARFLARHGVDYIELLLPRLFGAIVVGLSVLLLQDTGWKIGLALSWANWISLCLIVYGLSFMYIYLDVYKTVRLSPTGENLAGRTLHTSSQIFVISVIEAFLVTLVSTTLCAHAILENETLRQAATVMLPGVGRLDVFPRLILLWTGLALFIGAFLQLIWQDRQITSPW